MKFYVNPYNPSATGFYFETIEELQSNSTALKDEFGAPVDEFQIEFCDGTREEMELFERAEVTPAEIAEFIKFIDDANEATWPAVYFLMRKYSLESAIERVDHCRVIQASLLEVASDDFDDRCVIPDELRAFINYEKYAKEMEYSGSMVQFEFCWKTYTWCHR